jgi:hypothetical protein
MSTVRQIDELFSSEAKSVRLVKALVEFYKSSDPDVRHELEPGFYSLVSVIQHRIKDPEHRQSLQTVLADEGLVPVMDRWELKHELESAAPRGKV